MQMNKSSLDPNRHKLSLINVQVKSEEYGRVKIKLTGTEVAGTTLYTVLSKNVQLLVELTICMVDRAVIASISRSSVVLDIVVEDEKSFVKVIKDILTGCIIENLNQNFEKKNITIVSVELLEVEAIPKRKSFQDLKKQTEEKMKCLFKGNISEEEMKSEIVFCIIESYANATFEEIEVQQATTSLDSLPVARKTKIKVFGKNQVQHDKGDLASRTEHSLSPTSSVQVGSVLGGCVGSGIVFYYHTNIEHYNCNKEGLVPSSSLSSEDQQPSNNNQQETKEEKEQQPLFLQILQELLGKCEIGPDEHGRLKFKATGVVGVIGALGFYTLLTSNPSLLIPLTSCIVGGAVVMSIQRSSIIVDVLVEDEESFVKVAQDIVSGQLKERLNQKLEKENLRFDLVELTEVEAIPIRQSFEYLKKESTKNIQHFLEGYISEEQTKDKIVFCSIETYPHTTLIEIEVHGATTYSQPITHATKIKVFVKQQEKSGTEVSKDKSIVISAAFPIVQVASVSGGIAGASSVHYMQERGDRSEAPSSSDDEETRSESTSKQTSEVWDGGNAGFRRAQFSYMTGGNVGVRTLHQTIHNYADGEGNRSDAPSSSDEETRSESASKHTSYDFGILNVQEDSAAAERIQSKIESIERRSGDEQSRYTTCRYEDYTPSRGAGHAIVDKGVTFCKACICILWIANPNLKKFDELMVNTSFYRAIQSEKKNFIVLIPQERLNTDYHYGLPEALQVFDPLLENDKFEEILEATYKRIVMG